MILKFIVVYLVMFVAGYGLFLGFYNSLALHRIRGLVQLALIGAFGLWLACYIVSDGRMSFVVSTAQDWAAFITAGVCLLVGVVLAAYLRYRRETAEEEKGRGK